MLLYACIYVCMFVHAYKSAYIYIYIYIRTCIWSAGPKLMSGPPPAAGSQRALTHSTPRAPARIARSAIEEEDVVRTALPVAFVDAIGTVHSTAQSALALTASLGAMIGSHTHLPADDMELDRRRLERSQK